jgi:hypothetical protein
MIWFLRIAFLVVLITMLAVNGWAFSILPVWETPRSVVLHPWFVATLFDTYFAFTTFWLWLAYRETSWVARIIWLLGIYALGNIVMASYMLWIVWRLPANADVRQVLLRPNAT